jgi:uncharacterized protein YndB with AHSA1/START domain
MNQNINSAQKQLILTRIIDAPKELVYKAFTEAERLAHWWGPAGLKLEVLKLDLVKDGVFHYMMETPDGIKMYGKFVYKEIIPNQELVFVVSFSDEHEGIVRHPLSDTWPLEVINYITFESMANGKTRLILKGNPINANDNEINTFESNFESIENGFKGTFAQLDSYLASL